jgi:hypothetical protein
VGTGVLFVGGESSFVGGGARSGCWELFVGTGISFVGGGAHSPVVHVCGWAARSWVGGCCSWVLGCRLWAQWCRVVCCVVTISKIRWDEGGTHLINNINKNDEQQHRYADHR